MIRRIRPREAEALRAVNSRLPDVPEGGTFGSDRMAKPADWLDSRDSQGFLKRRARFTTDAVYWANPARLGTLFDAAGVPEDAVERFLAVAPELTPRPFSLLHRTSTRETSCSRCGGTVTGFSSSTGGRPRTATAARPGHPSGPYGLWGEVRSHDRSLGAGDAAQTPGGDRRPGKNLPVYLAFERVQSVFPDVTRDALTRSARPTDRDFVGAADNVCRAAGPAREALDPGKSRAPKPAVEAALRDWHEAERRVAHACGHGEGARGWDDSWKRRRRSGGLGGGAVSGMLSGTITASLIRVAAMPW